MKKAFTLSEVLVTLSILGVVAAISIPNVVHKQQEKQFITKLKKEYSAIENAYNIAIIENGPINSWNFKNSSYPVNGKNKQADIVLQKLVTHLNIQKNCGWEDTSCASEDTIYKTLNKNIDWVEPPSDQRYARAILKDGSLIFIFTYGSDCLQDTNQDICGYIRIDLNGEKSPNRLGVDVFDFILTSKQGIIPNGNTKEDSKHCNINSNNIYNGTACTYYALKEGKMNYLKSL